MGYYYNPTDDRTKADGLLSLGAQEITQSRATQLVTEAQTGIFCVVDNGMFDAAAFAYDAHELAAFTQPTDNRPKRFFLINRETAKRITGYKGT